MNRAGLTPAGRIATRLAVIFVPPYRNRCQLAQMTSKGYVAPSAMVSPATLKLGRNIFIDDEVIIFNRGGSVELEDRVYLHRDTIIEVGPRGRVILGADTAIQPRCQLLSYESAIIIGRGVQIASGCAFYSYDHGFAPDQPIGKQALTTRGPIRIEDDAWLGFGVIVLSGVRVGRGAVIGAGSVVTHDVPDGAIVMGVPARIAKMRSELPVGAVSNGT
jgi:acetyltransferase-like isoleucine patch superfamily enzyme